MSTRSAVETMYEAYFAGDAGGMLATLDRDVEVRFLGRGVYRGLDESRRFLSANTGMLTDLDFTIEHLIVDGEWAATVWHETAVTIHGEPYVNHGVDVFRVVDGRISVLHENNDVLAHRAAFGNQSPDHLAGDGASAQEGEHPLGGQ